MTDFDKSTRQGLLFFSIDFEFGECESLSSSCLKERRPPGPGAHHSQGGEALLWLWVCPSPVAEEGSLSAPPTGLVEVSADTHTPWSLTPLPPCFLP